MHFVILQGRPIKLQPYFGIQAVPKYGQFFRGSNRIAILQNAYAGPLRIAILRFDIDYPRMMLCEKY